MLLRKQAIKMYFISHCPHLTSASAHLEETGNPEIASCRLNAAWFFTTKHETQLKYHLVRAEPPFTAKTIDWMHQTGPRKGAYHPAVCYPHALCYPSLSRCQALCKRWELFFVKPGVNCKSQWRVLMGYLTISANVRRYQTSIVGLSYPSGRGPAYSGPIHWGLFIADPLR